VRTWLVVTTLALSACRASETPASVRAPTDAAAEARPGPRVEAPTTTTTTTGRGGPDAACVADGCLRSVSPVGT
jgi:hypothetical protein